MEQTAKQIVSKSRIKMNKYFPFFGTLAMSLVVRETDQIPTFATDGTHLFYNPDFVLQTFKDEGLDVCIAAVAHEVGHVHLMHLTRNKGKDKELYNIAGDYVINAMLKHSGLTLGKGWLYDAKYDGMSTDEVYQELKKNPPPKQGGGVGHGKGCCKKPEGTGHGKQLTQGDIERIEAATRRKIAQAAQVARMAGNLPAGMEKEIEAILNPPEPWQDILREFITNQTNNDYSWERGERSFLNRGLYIPSLYSEQMPHVVVVLDSSGSCEHAFSGFMDNLNSILEDCDPELVTVLHCDCSVAKVLEYTREDMPIPNTLHGGGGTSFCPAFNYVREHDLDPVCLIYFTDTYGDFPADEPDYPVIWACTEREHAVPWGTGIRITTENGR